MEDSPQGGETTPRPDPTVLTTALVKQAMEDEKERVEGLLQVLRERLAGMDLATDLRLKQTDHLPNLFTDKVQCVVDVVDEKFNGVEKQFEALKERMAEQKTDTQNAVTAAFAASDRAVSLQTEASEKSIAKSEASTMKQIDALGAQSVAAIDGIKDQITDLKLSVERITAAKIGGIDQRSEMRNQGLDNRGAIALAISAVLFVVTVVVAAVALTNGP